MARVSRVLTHRVRRARGGVPGRPRGRGRGHPRHRCVHVAGQDRLADRGGRRGGVRGDPGHEGRRLRGSDASSGTSCGATASGVVDRRLPPRHPEREERGCARGGELLPAHRPQRTRRRDPRPRHRGDGWALDPRPSVVGPHLGHTRPGPDRRAPDDLHEPQLLAHEPGRHDLVRRARLPPLDRELGRAAAPGDRGGLGRERLDLLAVDRRRSRQRPGDRDGDRPRRLRRRAICSTGRSRRSS